MAELVRSSVREQIGAADPAVHAPGVTVRALDLPGQFLVTGGPAVAPNTRAEVDPYRMWLAPDRTLVVCERSHAQPEGAFVSDLTDGFAVFEIAGPRAAELIAASATLDAATFAPGRCAQTLFGGVKVLLYAYGDGFRIHAERPFAAFLLEWFSQAASASAATPEEMSR
jgi:heterotetrameric sarcosine oxidase gamma subunit